MKSKRMNRIFLASLATAAMLSMTGCCTSAGTNLNLYTSNMKRILAGSQTSGGSKSSSTSASTREKTEIAAAASFTIDGDTYTFSGVENAAQYIIYLCQQGSVDDSDDYLYSGVISADGSAEYTGSISQLISHAYGDYTAKVFAVASDFTMSAGTITDYSVSGPLPAPEIAYSYDGHGVLTLQVANTSAYDSSAIPDSIEVTLAGPASEVSAAFDSTMSDQEVEGIEAGDYTITAVAVSSASYVTVSPSEESIMTASFGSEEVASDNYQAPQQMGGPGGGMAGWTLDVEDISFAEGDTGFAFSIGEPDFFHTTANLAEVPDEGSLYTYNLANGDPNAPFENTMKLQICEDGTAVVTTTAAGPINNEKKYGTWVNEGGTISVTWE